MEAITILNNSTPHGLKPRLALGILLAIAIVLSNVWIATACNSTPPKYDRAADAVINMSAHIANFTNHLADWKEDHDEKVQDHEGRLGNLEQRLHHVERHTGANKSIKTKQGYFYDIHHRLNPDIRVVREENLVRRRRHALIRREQMLRSSLIERLPDIMATISSAFRAIASFIDKALTFPTADASKIVFTPSGRLATAAAYIHAYLPVPLKDFSSQIQEVGIILAKVLDTVAHKRLNVETHPLTTAHLDNLADVLNQKSVILAELRNQSQHLRDVLPNPQDLSASSPILKDVPTDIISTVLRSGRTKRFNALTATAAVASFPLGILGTLWGWYNRQQIANLRATLNDHIRDHDLLVLTVSENAERLANVSQAVIDLSFAIEDMVRTDSATLSARADVMLAALTHRLNLLRDLITQAHHRRLAPTFLPPASLRQLLQDVFVRASQRGYHPLVRLPTDLLQTELSYMHDGEVMHMVLHVPMVPKGCLFRLYRFLPFPLPVPDTDFVLLPQPAKQLLALGDNSKAVTLHTSELVNCRLLGDVHVCENVGVVYNDFRHTCLGALYAEQWQWAQQHCPFQVRKSDHWAVQLSETAFLLYAPTPILARIRCGSTIRDTDVQISGTSILNVTAGCRAETPKHTLFTSLASKDSTVAIAFHWTWDSRDLFRNVTTNIISDAVHQLRFDGEHRPNGHAIREKINRLLSKTAMASQAGLLQTPAFHYTSLSLISAFILFIVICILTFLGFRCLRKRNLINCNFNPVRPNTPLDDLSDSFQPPPEETLKFSDLRNRLDNLHPNY